MEALSPFEHEQLLRDPIAMKTYLQLVNTSNVRQNHSPLDLDVVADTLKSLGYAVPVLRNIPRKTPVYGDREPRQLGKLMDSTRQKTKDQRISASAENSKRYGELSRKLHDNKPYGGAFIMKDPCNLEHVSEHFRCGPFCSTAFGDIKPSTLAQSHRDNKCASARYYRNQWSSSDIVKRLA